MTRALLESDYYQLLADYGDYVAAQARVDEVYRRPTEWTRQAILNIAGMVVLDRTIREYADEIWNVAPIPRPAPPGWPMKGGSARTRRRLDPDQGGPACCAYRGDEARCMGFAGCRSRIALGRQIHAPGVLDPPWPPPIASRRRQRRKPALSPLGLPVLHGEAEQLKMRISSATSCGCWGLMRHRWCARSAPVPRPMIWP